MVLRSSSEQSAIRFTLSALRAETQRLKGPFLDIDHRKRLLKMPLVLVFQAVRRMHTNSKA